MNTGHVWLSSPPTPAKKNGSNVYDSISEPSNSKLGRWMTRAANIQQISVSPGMQVDSNNLHISNELRGMPPADRTRVSKLDRWRDRTSASNACQATAVSPMLTAPSASPPLAVDPPAAATAVSAHPGPALQSAGAQPAGTQHSSSKLAGWLARASASPTQPAPHSPALSSQSPAAPRSAAPLPAPAASAAAATAGKGAATSKLARWAARAAAAAATDTTALLIKVSRYSMLLLIKVL